MYLTADLSIDIHERRAYRGKSRIDMSALTFDVLALLVSHGGKVVTLETLMDQIWQNKVVGPETVTQRIAMLRKALNNHQTTEYIASIRGEGYRWVPQVHNNQTQPQTQKPIKITFVFTILFIGLWLIWLNRDQLIGQPSDASDHLHNPQQSNDPQPNIQLDPIEETLLQAKRYYNRFSKSSTEQAAQLYQQVLQQDPDSISALTGLSSTYAQLVSKFNAPPDLLAEAEQIARKAVRLAPDDSDSIATLGYVLDVQGKITAAISHYEQALALNPDNYGLQGGLAYLYGISGNLVNALRLNVSAFSGEQNYRHLQIAQILHFLEFNALAERWYQMADQLNPDSVFAASARAEFYLTQGQLQKAKKITQTALDRGVERAELHLLIAQIALLQQQPEQAQAAFNQAQKINAGAVEVRVWKAWADSYFVPKKPQPALMEDISVLRQTLSEHMKSGDYWPDQHEYLAVLAMAENLPEDAIDQLQQAFARGLLDADRLLQLPVFNALETNPRFLELIESIRNEVQRQRQTILNADWLPDDFLNSGSR